MSSSQLTYILQRGWNHQPVSDVSGNSMLDKWYKWVVWCCCRFFQVIFFLLVGTYIIRVWVWVVKCGRLSNTWLIGRTIILARINWLIRSWWHVAVGNIWHTPCAYLRFNQREAMDVIVMMVDGWYLVVGDETRVNLMLWLSMFVSMSCPWIYQSHVL